MPTFLGSWLVAVHNSFKLHWSTLISILGWLMLVGGAFRAWFPAVWVGFFPRFENESCMVICGGISLVIGLILFFLGVRYSQKA